MQAAYSASLAGNEALLLPDAGTGNPEDRAAQWRGRQVGSAAGGACFCIMYDATSACNLVHRVFVTGCLQGEAGSGAAHDELLQQLLAAREEVALLQAERAAAELPAPALAAWPQDGANAASVLQAEGQQGGLSGSASALPAAVAIKSPSLSSQMGSAAHGSAADWLTPNEDIGEVSVWSRPAPEAASAVPHR